MQTIDITQILSPDLKSRVSVKDLKLFVENSKGDVTFDFRNVKFATRSFVDEFYNVFLKSPNTNTSKVQITNVPEDICKIFDAVSHTQTRIKTIPSDTPERIFKNTDELISYLSYMPTR